MNLEDQRGERRTLPIFSRPSTGWKLCRISPFGMYAFFPRPSCGRSTNRLRASSRVFQRGCVSHMPLTYRAIPLAIPPLFLLSKNCNALARDPLSIPLLNLRPYYRMPRERGRKGGASRRGSISRFNARPSHRNGTEARPIPRRVSERGLA